MIGFRISRKKVNPDLVEFTGHQNSEKVSAQLISYSTDQYSFHKDIDPIQLTDLKTTSRHWINLNGIHNIDIVTRICESFNFDSFYIQDILDVNQSMKVEFNNNDIFVVLKSVLPNNGTLFTEQISFLLGRNYCISFQEKSSAHFEHIRKRISTNASAINSKEIDHLFYLLVESILDNYAISAKFIEEELDDLGILDLTSDPSPLRLRKIESLKRQCHQVSRNLINIKDIIAKLIASESKLVHADNQKYYSELKDFCVTLIEDCEKITLRLDSAANMFFSVQGFRMNQTMKTLTIIATVFIPLTFIAGVYGMNFKNITELNMEYGYFIFWGIVLVLTAVILWFFKKMKWINRKDR